MTELKKKAEKASGKASEQDLRARLQQLEALQREDPMTNPVRMIALDILKGATGKAGSFEIHLGKLLQGITARSFDARAKSLANYIGPLDIAENSDRLTRFFNTLAEEKKQSGGFDAFRDHLNQPALGLVFTAHPTFGLRRDLRRALCELAANETVGGAPLDKAAVESRLKMAHDLPHGPDPAITLDLEHDQAEEAIAAAQIAMRRIMEIVLSVAAEHFPDQWRSLIPKPMSIASWVGYDLDGRSDIGWLQILQKRSTVRARQLNRYLTRIVALADGVPLDDPGRDSLAAAQRAIEDASALATHEAGLFAEASSDDATSIKQLVARLAEGDSRRVTDPAVLVDLLSEAVDTIADAGMAQSVSALRAEIAMLGFGTAHVHVRLNASQIHNAVARAIGMEGTPEDPGTRRRYMGQLTSELSAVKPVSINFRSVLMEQTTARSLFMTVRLIQTYMDSTTPLRFLIAESDTAFTVLSALYFAKLFDVEKTAQISPLFETPIALEKGADIIAELLENPDYRNYVQEQGRLCIQTGFSDAGRYLGQLAASLAVERLHIKLARLLEKRGIKDIEVLIFDTHGESMGRGAHPGGLKERFAYLGSPKSRSVFKAAGIPLKQEISFQGGDGYCFFATPKLALGTLGQMVEHAMTPAPESVDDPFYQDPDHTLDFFLTITRFNEQLMADRDFASLIGSFGVNMVPKMGSRTVKRAHEAARGIDRESMSQIRAISQNAILHQLGWLANTAGGTGAAIHRNLGWFIDMHAKSPRLRQMMAMAQAATNVGSVDALMAYARTFDPSFWLARAQTAEPSPQRDRLRALSRILDNHRRFERMSRICRRLIQDHIDFVEGMAVVDAKDRPPAALPDSQVDLKLLHAIRLAAMQRLFLLSTNIPRFAPRLDFTREDVVNQILNLEVKAAVGELREMFPATSEFEEVTGFGGEATYTTEAATNYAREHERLFDPMEALYDIILRTSAAIAYHTGAHG